MKDIINLAFILPLIFVLLACTPKTTCNAPYILVGQSCCLDENSNAMCDKDEANKVTKELVVQESPVAPQEAPVEALLDKSLADNLNIPVSCNMEAIEREFNHKEYYRGPLIDTHVHMPVASSVLSSTAMQYGFEDMPHRGQVRMSRIACLFDAEGIINAFGFFMTPNMAIESSVSDLKSDLRSNREKFSAFLMPLYPFGDFNPSVSEVASVFKSNPSVYQGYGEVRGDFNFGSNPDLESSYLMSMYQLADEHGLIVQIHPAKGQVDVLERLLKKFPNVIFLAHVMWTEREQVAKLMESYPNLYYSLDAEINSIYGYHTIQNNRGPSKEEYLAFIRKDFDKLLTEALTLWKPIVEKHPNRFTWGSDRWYTWHFDPEVGGLLVEFGRTFIGHLDPSVQEKIAYKNAETMLKNR